MTGDKNSSSQGGSSVVMQNNTPRTFDVGNEKELLNLLVYIRRGPFLPDQKSMLRDVVLDFVVGKDPVVLGVVEGALSRSGAALFNNGVPFTPAPAAAPAEPAEEAVAEVAHDQLEGDDTQPQAQAPKGFAGGRPRPTFGSPTSTPVPEPTRSVPVISAEPKPDAVVPTADDQPSQPTPPVSPSTAKDPVSETPVTPMQEERQATQSAHEEKAPAAPAQPMAEPSTDPLTRIKQIKNLVNQKVGNPVNLIDADNTIGREYMNALLGAMKSINGSTPDEVMLAMQRLEKAYQTIEKSLALGTFTVQKSKAKEQPQLPKDPVASAFGGETDTPEEQPAVPPKEQPQLVDLDSTVQGDSVPPDVPAGFGETKLPQSEASEPEPQSGFQASEPESVPKPEPEPKSEPQPEPVAAPQPKVQSPPIPERQPQAVPAASLAAQIQKERAAQSDTAAQKAAELNAQKDSLTKDPLKTDEVNRGLHQLLSEWRLFKSSGIFGTGPNGYEHPLYRSIAPLPMAAVIAGRFDGVTPEIRQSISDYMSGWRYEQGVVHEMNESFDHYLRRVVHKILEKQKNNRVV